MNRRPAARSLGRWRSARQMRASRTRRSQPRDAELSPGVKTVQILMFEPATDSRQRHGWKRNRDKRSHHPDLEAGILDARDQSGARIAPLMLRVIVGGAPQPLSCGTVTISPLRGSRPFAAPPVHRVIVDVLEHVERADEVELAIKRQRSRVRLHQSQAGHLPRATRSPSSNSSVPVRSAAGKELRRAPSVYPSRSQFRAPMLPGNSGAPSARSGDCAIETTMIDLRTRQSRRTRPGRIRAARRSLF